MLSTLWGSDVAGKAFSYIRFSSRKQADGDSIRRQTEMRDGYLQRKGLTLDTSLTMADLGKSAWKGDNADTGALAEFLALCKSKVVPPGSILIVENLDRLTRQHVRKAMELFFDILDAGVTIVTLNPEREYTPDTGKNFFTLVEPLMFFAIANEKSETLSLRLRAAWAGKRKDRKPMTTWTPAWLRMKADRSGFELIPENAEVIKLIVKLALSGYGDLRLVKKLNDDKVAVISGHKHWTSAYVSKILRTSALIGHYEPGIEKDGKRVMLGEVWEGYFPAVIGLDDWHLLRAARQSRTYQRGPVGDEVANLFTGLLKNPRDGQPYQRLVKNHARLVSASYRNGLSGGDTLTFPYKPLENAFLFALANEIKLQDLFGADHTIKVDRVAVLMAELDTLKAKVKQVKEAVANQPDIKAFLELLADLETKQRAVHKELKQEQARSAERSVEAETFSDLQALAKLWSGKVEDKTDLRTRIKAKVRRLVAEMWMAVYGKKKSKWKTAEVQIFFKAGGSKILVVHVEENEIVRVELTEHSETGVAVAPALDFRHYLDPEKGKTVRSYDEWNLQCHQSPDYKPPRRKKTDAGDDEPTTDLGHRPKLSDVLVESPKKLGRVVRSKAKKGS